MGANSYDHQMPNHQVARAIINDLRRGVPPMEHVCLFSIGREHLLDYFAQTLDEVAKFDEQGVKFIQADYGQGKTHFLNMLAQLALERNFVVSTVTLDRETAPFNKLERVVPRIMQGLGTQQSRRNALGSLLQEWAKSVHGLRRNAVLYQIDQEDGLDLLFPDFRLKLADYAGAYNQPNGPAYDACLQIERWFRGEETRSKTFKSIPAFLAAFVQFVRYLGYSGLVVMLDEAESITVLSRITNRDQANENLRQIIDNQDLESFYFVFASTPSFLGGEDDRGAQTYPALWRRISDPLGQIEQHALDKVIVELPSLTVEEFSQLAWRIKAIYGIAYKGAASVVEDQHLEWLAQYVEERTDRSVRTLVRSAVMLLDEARKAENLDVLATYELVVEQIIADEERRLGY